MLFFFDSSVGKTKQLESKCQVPNSSWDQGFERMDPKHLEERGVIYIREIDLEESPSVDWTIKHLPTIFYNRKVGFYCTSKITSREFDWRKYYSGTLVLSSVFF